MFGLLSWLWERSTRVYELFGSGWAALQNIRENIIDWTYGLFTLILTTLSRSIVNVIAGLQNWVKDWFRVQIQLWISWFFIGLTFILRVRSIIWEWYESQLKPWILSYVKDFIKWDNWFKGQIEEIKVFLFVDIVNKIKSNGASIRNFTLIEGELFGLLTFFSFDTLKKTQIIVIQYFSLLSQWAENPLKFWYQMVESSIFRYAEYFIAIKMGSEKASLPALDLFYLELDTDRDLKRR